MGERHAGQALAFACAGAIVAAHGARAALDVEAQAQALRWASFVPARLWGLIAPDAVAARLAAAPRESVEIAAYWLADGAAPWSAFTYALAHSGWGHALSNALLLTAFGAPLARRLTPARFLGLLGIGAFAGAAAQMSAIEAAFAPLVGASGCVCALIGASARAMTEPGAILGAQGPAGAAMEGLGAALRRPQGMAALAAGLVAIAVTGLGPQEAAAIGWRAHVGGFLAGFAAIGALSSDRKAKHAQTCRGRRTDASSESDCGEAIDGFASRRKGEHQ